MRRAPRAISNTHSKSMGARVSRAWRMIARGSFAASFRRVAPHFIARVAKGEAAKSVDDAGCRRGAFRLECSRPAARVDDQRRALDAHPFWLGASASPRPGLAT